MSYIVYYSEEAERDLHNIFQYIAFNLSAPIAARRQTDEIMKEIESLDENPLRYPVYKHEPWYSMGLRFFPVNNYIIFYLPDESNMNVNIVRIMYGGRDIEKQLNN